jgi:hypothetical protein
MAAITANADLIKRAPSDINLYAVGANQHIYKNSLVGLHPFTLYAEPFKAGDFFVGIAYEEIDNTLGAATAGLKSVRVYDQGEFVCYLASVAVADLGKEVYALDSSGTVAVNGHYDGFMGHIVGIDDVGAKRSEHLGYRALAAGDVARQSDDVHASSSTGAASVSHAAISAASDCCSASYAKPSV